MKVCLLLFTISALACGGGSQNSATPSSNREAHSLAESDARQSDHEETAADLAVEPAELPSTDEGMAQALLAYGMEMADAVAAANGDCDAIGTNINKVVDRNELLVKKGRVWQERQEAQELMEQYRGEMMAVGEQLRAAVTPCLDNESVRQAMSRLELPAPVRAKAPAQAKTPDP